MAGKAKRNVYEVTVKEGPTRWEGTHYAVCGSMSDAGRSVLRAAAELGVVRPRVVAVKLLGKES